MQEIRRVRVCVRGKNIGVDPTKIPLILSHVHLIPKLLFDNILAESLFWNAFPNHSLQLIRHLHLSYEAIVFQSDQF